jgi:ribulose-5-phosphate 4-epimerase/fuculose-1-phosphate aldolase
MTDVREQLAATAKSMFERRLTFGSSGNISVKSGDGWLMSPTNVSLGALDPARLSQLDASGKHVGGDAPTKESFLHLAMYRERAGAGAVVHLHSTHSVAVSLPLIPYYAPGDPTLADAVGRLAAKHSAVLLANHGPVVAGSSLSAAVNAIEELEETARLYLLLHGRPTCYLTPEQVADLRKRFPNA